MTEETTMRIGEVAECTELSFRTLRHYDEIGLVEPSARTEGGFRLYTEDDVRRIMLVRRMKPLGFTLDEMGDLLQVVDGLADDPEDAELRRRLGSIREEAAVRRAKLTRQVAMADEFLDQLSDI